MHIACIGNRWFPEAGGGLDRYLYDLAHTLADQGDRVNFFCLGNPQPSPPQLQAHSLGPAETGLVSRLWNIRRQVQQGLPPQTDVINPHFALNSWPIVDLLDRPVVAHFHGPWAMESQWEGSHPWVVACKHWVETQAFRQTSQFITLSHAFKKILHTHYRVPEQRIQVIPGGVDTQVFRPLASRAEARSALGWPQDRLILFTPRRLVRRMGLAQLIAAVGRLPQPDLWLGIAGRGPLTGELTQQIAELGLENRVKLLGFLSEADLVRAYQAADLTVVPSQALEGFGLVLVESLACGTPALATPVGAMPEVLQPFSPDLIASGSDSRALAELLAALLSGQVPLPRGQACRDYAQTNFAWPVISHQVRQVFHAVLNG